MLKHYVLDAEHRTIEVSFLVWAKWFENFSNRIVAWTQVTSQIEVSTIFIGIDHRHFSKGPPILFETMIFGGPLNESTWRYSSWDDAVVGHEAAVKKARASIKQRVE